MNKKAIVHIIITIFILLFAYTAIIKLSNNDQFLRQLKQSPILKPYAGTLLLLVPCTELFIAILLITRRWRLEGLYLSFIIMALFTVYIIILNKFSYYIPCSCGGWLEKLSPDIHITLNTSLTLIALLGIYSEKKNRTPQLFDNLKNNRDRKVCNSS